jgi:hypothetical protein
MGAPTLRCLLCGRAIDEEVALAFATVVDGETQAVCTDCATHPEAASVLAGLFGLAAPAPEMFLPDRFSLPPSRSTPAPETDDRG